jgi:amino acid adenylation domain-containing protein
VTEATVTAMVEAQVARTPDAVAVVAPDGELTYRQLDDRAERLARTLVELGVGPDVAVGVFLERCLDLPVALAAILKAGGACLPLDPSVPGERLAFMLSDAAVPVVVTHAALGGRLPNHHASVICLDGDDPGAGVAGAPAGAAVRRTAGGDDLAYVIYTSGSTGRPKGVMLPHAALVAHHRAVMDLYRLAPGDRVLQFCSISFDVSIEEMFPSWAAGATVVLRDDAVATLGRPWLAWLRQAGVTTMNLPTAYWHEWVRDLDAIREKVPDGIRLVTVGGEKALGRAYRTWHRLAGPDVRWINAYGPAEASIMATYFEPAGDEDDPGWVDPPIGRPLGSTTVHLLDADANPVAPGTTGELCIGGPGLARGYLNQPALTAERFIPDPFAGVPGGRLYRTGDLARILPDGNLDFVGRNDQQVKIRGFRIECAEVETVLRSHPDVADVAVVAREDTPGTKRLVGYVVAAAGAALTPASLRGIVSERLPPYMVPSVFVILTALPITANGKVDRTRLPVPDLSNRPIDPDQAPATSAEKTLAAIWAQVLGIGEVGVDENFFDLGGHSLTATQVVARAREAFGVELPLHAIFESPTIRGLAAVVESRGTGPGESRPALPLPLAPAADEVRRRAPLSLAQEQMWALESDPASIGLYNITVQHRLAEPVDQVAVRQALTYLAQRHEALRTSFHRDADGLFQSVVPSVSVVLPVTDLRPTPVALRPRELQRRIAAVDAEPIGLDRAPLWRAHLFQVDDEASVLTVTFDHMISDGTSAYVFSSEFADVYAALAQGQAPELPPLPVQYRDYALWQRDWLTAQRQDADLEYWKEKLARMPLGPALAFDHLPAAPTRRISARDLVVPVDEYAGLRRVAQGQRATMFMVLAAIVEAVLSALGGATDIVLSTTLSGRQRAELEGVIGYFAGIGRLRTDLVGNPAFSEILARTRDSALGLFNHQDLPFMRIRDALLPGFSAGGHPLARLPIEFQYFHAGHDGWAPGLGVVERPGAAHDADLLFFRGQLHPLSVTLLDDGAQAWGEITYKSDFYDPATIERLARGIDVVIETVAAKPDTSLSELEHLVRRLAEVPPSTTAHRRVGTWVLDASDP